jgi:predicted nucleic acid-binding protein
VVHALILETTFLIDLERELGVAEPGPAHRFLEAHPDHQLYITFTVAGEMAAGPRLNERGSWDTIVSPFEVLGCTPDVCWRYGRLYRYLKSNGLLIGTNDLWIAATAQAFGIPLVTRNERHFSRVPELDVVGYR